MDRRSVLKMTTAIGAGGAALHASSLLAADRAAITATEQAAASPIAQLPRASFIHRTDGTALFYKDWGTGTPVVFVNSAGLTSDMWVYQMVPLTSHGMRCVAFDRRGHGRSSDPGRGYDFDTLADDLAAVIETLSLRNVTLVGHSMGCAEITRYLARHGSSRIARAVLLAPTTPFLLKTPEWGTSMTYTTSLQAQIECNIALTETDFRQDLAGIKVPVLLIHGTKDVSAPFPLTGQRTARLIPACELKVYEGAPHGLFLTHMERVNEDLLRFIQA